VPSEKKTITVTGEFDVRIAPPHAIDVPPNGPRMGRHAMDKVYHGALNGLARGEMLTAGKLQQGQATYVALESFEGTLDGMSGGFALAHLGHMDAGSDALSVSIVPGSGSGALAEIRGELEIVREDGKHTYTLTYWMT
jgi:hypothetical protein